MDMQAVGRQASLGSALEQALRWGLPASPLFLAVLMLLAHAPYASPIVAPALFYLACMAGALIGFAGCALIRTWDRMTSVGTCWFGGAVLEISWFVLLYAEHAGSAPMLLLGSLLAGTGTAWLLVLWLWVGQTDSLACEVAKLACVFAVAFALYSLFSVVPHGGVISYLFPVATCVPLTMMLRAETGLGDGTRPGVAGTDVAERGDMGVREAAEDGEGSAGSAGYADIAGGGLGGVWARQACKEVRSSARAEGRTDGEPAGTAQSGSHGAAGTAQGQARRPSLGRIVVTGLLLASFGAGFSALGFGGERVEQGAGLLALLLVSCLVATPNRTDLLRLASMPLVVIALCYDALAGHGNAFAFFLAGCGSLIIWLFLQHRFGWPELRWTNPREIALRLLFVALSAGAGMALGQVGLDALGVEAGARPFMLVIAVVLADVAWRGGALTTRGAWAGDDLHAAASSASGAGLGANTGMGLDATMRTAGGAGAADTPAAENGSAAFPTVLARQLALSPREEQVAGLLCQSRSVSYISKMLGMAASTTKTHVRHVYEKAGVHSRDELQLLVEHVPTGDAHGERRG